MTVLHDIIHEKSSGNGSPVLDFFVLISYEFAFANSSANAILFLMTNVKTQSFSEVLEENKKGRSKEMFEKFLDPLNLISMCLFMTLAN